jgi:isoleucyl-tRNA synthetase
MLCVAPGVGARALEPLVPLLAAELNVKQVEFVSSGADLVTLEAKPNFRALGRRFGKGTPVAAQAIQRLDGATLQAFQRGEPVAIEVDGVSTTLLAEEVEVLVRASGGLAVQEQGGYFAAIDPTVTPELRLEGMARELISRVQRLRKESGLAVSDRIRLEVAGGGVVRELLGAHGAYVAGEVLAVEVVAVETRSGSHHATAAVDLDGTVAELAITRAD